MFVSALFSVISLYASLDNDDVTKIILVLRTHIAIGRMKFCDDLGLDFITHETAR